VEQWLPELSKADTVDCERRISSNIFAAGWIADWSCEDIASRCVTDLVCWELLLPTDRQQKNRDEFKYREIRVRRARWLEQGLMRNSLLMLLLLFQEFVQKIPAFLAEIIWLDRTSESFADFYLSAATGDGSEHNENSHRHTYPCAR
jgi:hypothetical protein